MVTLFAKLFYPLIIITALSVFLLHYAVAGQAVYGDGVGYYAYLHSIVIDGDLDTTNEYKHIYTPANNNSPDPQKADSVQIVRSVNGKALNHFGIGPAILLLPFYLTANSISLILNFLGLAVPLHGFSDIYQILTGAGAVIYVILGLYVIERLIFLLNSDKTAARLAVTAIFFATNLVYYGSFDVINSHFASFFVMSVIIYIYFGRDNSSKKYIILGLLTGFIANIRPQDSLLGLILLADLIYRKFNIKTIMNFIIAFISGIAVMFCNWTIQIGNPLRHKYITEMQSFGNKSFDWMGSLFSANTGLLRVSPILVFALAYLGFMLYRKKIPYKHVLLSLFLLFQFLIITFHGGWQAAAYGGRMYISTFPFLALIFADLIQISLKRVGKALTLLIISTFILFNLFSMLKFLLYEKQTEGQNAGTETKTLTRLENFRRSAFED